MFEILTLQSDRYISTNVSATSTFSGFWEISWAFGYPEVKSRLKFRQKRTDEQKSVEIGVKRFRAPCYTAVSVLLYRVLGHFWAEVWLRLLNRSGSKLLSKFDAEYVESPTLGKLKILHFQQRLAAIQRFGFLAMFTFDCLQAGKLQNFAWSLLRTQVWYDVTHEVTRRRKV